MIIGLLKSKTKKGLLIPSKPLCTNQHSEALAAGCWETSNLSSLEDLLEERGALASLWASSFSLFFSPLSLLSSSGNHALYAKPMSPDGGNHLGAGLVRLAFQFIAHSFWRSFAG
jgi:hypothetical protein